MDENVIRHETRLVQLGKQLTDQCAQGVPPIGMRVSCEIRYGQEYQALVRLGRKQQLRKKYRG